MSQKKNIYNVKFAQLSKGEAAGHTRHPAPQCRPRWLPVPRTLSVPAFTSTMDVAPTTSLTQAYFTNSDDHWCPESTVGDRNCCHEKKR